MKEKFRMASWKLQNDCNRKGTMRKLLGGRGGPTKCPERLNYSRNINRIRDKWPMIYSAIYLTSRHLEKKTGLNPKFGAYTDRSFYCLLIIHLCICRWQELIPDILFKMLLPNHSSFGTHFLSVQNFTSFNNKMHIKTSEIYVISWHLSESQTSGPQDK